MNDELQINERVAVIASFNSGVQPCTPRRFRRPNGQEITITEIGLRHPNTQGTRMVHIFDVTDGQADYRLEFDAQRLTWCLTMIGDRV